MPKPEVYELGSQLRRSAYSVNSNIVENYGRKRYKKDFIKFLKYSYSSEMETKNHFKKIEFVYPNLAPETSLLSSEYDKLSIKIHNFITNVENKGRT